MHAMVERTHLVDRLHRSGPRRVTLMAAPAGYGKTTLAQQWARTARHPVACLSISPFHNSAPCLLEGILHAIGRVASAPIEAPSHAPQVATVITAMDTVVQDSGSLTVVIDDFENIADPDALAAVNALIAGMPHGAHIMVLGRWTPRLTLARLLATGQLCHLTAADLRFGVDEVEAAAAGQTLTSEDVRRLADRTEGWITGIRLALDVRARHGQDAPIDDVLDALPPGSWLTRYFQDEALDRLPAALREFVLLTSALPVLQPALCAAALEIDNAEERLHDLVAYDVFVTQLAPVATDLRYHRMFAESMTSIASRELGIARLRDVWNRAASYLADRDRLGDALELAARAQNWNLATRCAERFVRNPDDQDHVGIVQRRLGLLPREILLGNDLLAHAYIQASSYAGNLRDAASIAGAMLPRWTTSDDPELRGYGASTIGHQHVLDGDNQVALDHLREALRLMPDDRVLDRLHSWTAVSHLEFLSNNTEAADRAYREAARCRARLGRSPYMWEMYTRPDRANQLAMRGDLHAAEETYRDLYLYSTEVHRTPMSKPLAILASIYLEWRQFDLALETVARMADDQDAFPYDIWRPEGLNLAAEVFLACEMPEDAARSLHASISLLNERGGTMHLRRARAIEARLWLRAGKRGRAREWAEIEQHQPPLPSRSFRDFDPRLALIEILLDEGRWADAAAVARQGIDDSPSPNRTAPRLRFLVWHAVALAMGGEAERSDMALRDALEIGALGTFLAAFDPPGYDLGDQLDRVRETAPPGIQAYIDQVTGRHPQAPSPAPREAAPSSAGQESREGSLTPREREVLALMQQGHINRQIADQLYITERTVKKHIANIRMKLDAPNRTAAVVRAYEVGLLD